MVILPITDLNLKLAQCFLVYLQRCLIMSNLSEVKRERERGREGGTFFHNYAAKQPSRNSQWPRIAAFSLLNYEAAVIKWLSAQLCCLCLCAPVIFSPCEGLLWLKAILKRIQYCAKVLNHLAFLYSLLPRSQIFCKKKKKEFMWFWAIAVQEKSSLCAPNSRDKPILRLHITYLTFLVQNLLEMTNRA